MKILIVLADRKIGGGQIAALRIASALAKTNKVFVSYAIPEWVDNEPPAIPLGVEYLKTRKGLLSRAYCGSLLRLSIYTSRLAQGLNFNINHQGIVDRALIVIHRIAGRQLIREIRKLEIDLINTHVWWADAFIGENLVDNETVPWVITMHGCYEGFIDSLDLMPAHRNKINEILKRADQVVYVADKNLRILKFMNKHINRNKFHKIYTGIEIDSGKAADTGIKQLEKADLVLGIISRAIPEKGWEQAILATCRIRDESGKNIHLLLAGEGSYKRELQHRYDFPYVHFLGNIEAPLEWARKFDLGLLPTYFPSESLPTTIVEYLVAGKPVIATNVGEVRQMLSVEEGLAGTLLPDPGINPVPVGSLVDAIRKYLDDSHLLHQQGRLAQRAAKKFSMTSCVMKYQKVFESAVESRKSLKERT